MTDKTKPLAKAVLDANVLAEAAVSDLLLRLAESAGAFAPIWTDQILDETLRTLINRLNWPAKVAESRVLAANLAFPEALVGNFEHHIASCTNDEKDRHVLAAAIEANALMIITLNIKHFRETDLSAWGVIAIHPSDFLSDLAMRHPFEMEDSLEAMGRRIGGGNTSALSRLSATIPRFADQIAAQKGITFPPYKPKNP